MVIYELNDAQRAESIYFETKEAAIRAGAGICYERYGGSFKFFLILYIIIRDMKI